MQTRSSLLTRVSIVGATVLAAVALTACGPGNPEGSKAIPNTDNDWYEVTVPYRGDTIHCLVLKKGDDRQTYGGHTCDFERFYKEAR